MDSIIAYDIYATPKGKPKQWRKVDTAYSEDTAKDIAWRFLMREKSVRIVKRIETVDRYL
ncbi:hypothetical protein RUESEDTHA_03598 [Ruegeria sp. THAF57]|nr:hypothetical protein RUESEDTHA_03598 [Ruegeria sp. THAF57]